MAEGADLMRVLFIDPGRFSREVTLLAHARLPDGAGGYLDEFSESAVFMAQVEPVDSHSYRAAGQRLEEVSHRVTFRHRDGVSAGMRLRSGNRTFEIITVHDPDETGRYLVCACKEQME